MAVGENFFLLQSEFFLKKCPSAGPLHWTSGDFSPGFESQGGFLTWTLSA